LAVDFEKDVFPIFEARCLDCHDRESVKGGVVLDSYHFAQLPTDAGDRLFVPGKPDDSVLVHVVEESDPDHRMPPKGPPLSSEEIATLRAWIEAGAEWPDDGWRPPTHWAYLAPTRPGLPELSEEDAAELEGRNANEIDAFVVSRLADEGLALNPETEPERLVRRVHLDLVGLPPSLETVAGFAADPSFERYEQLVDGLLASPAFGEKWAVQWLDLARYADSEGYQRDAPRTMWPWRDWVIEALNDDMPFDRFTIEQLAGDLLPNATESQRVASAFHRNAPTNLEAGTDPEEDRYKVVADRVNTSGTIWLGSTMVCAQCHNHKYDPFSAREYYELFAFFNNTPMESRQLGEEMGMSGLEPIGPTLAVSLSDEDRRDLRRAEREFEAERSRIERAVRAAAAEELDKDPEKREKLAGDLRGLLEGEDALSLQQCRQLMTQTVGNLPRMRVRLDKAAIMESRLEAMRSKELRVMEELEEMRPTRIARRGDFLSPGEAVEPATPAALHPFDEDLPRNRLGLAKWLVDPANPLVGRAFVNRLWIEVFGQGLVTTPEDFGTQGEPPTHPELLDWLALAFVEEDQWSLKRSLRRIVLSATYRQSIAVNETYAAQDPRNQLLWRHPGHRLGAETIRDQALAISGLLHERIGGAPVRPYQPDDFWRPTAGVTETYYLPSRGEDAHRRGVYTLWRRNAHYPSFANFDAPDRAACTVQRDVSNTPLQALTLLNDPAYVEMAEAFAARIASEGGEALEDRIDWAFRTALARSPRESERQLLRSAYQTVLASSGCEERAHRELATILLNLHESITRS